ncbi:hypothetical protein [Streptomyces sp. LN785]|uniref:hypothetical protein n=1 Tax=Streptomyces sp. LN785 TaxID=3112983 RepID=UPI00370FC6E4
MFIILGLVVLIAAVVVAVAGVLGNSGSGHGITRGFEVFGYHVTGSTGTLFLYGIVVGAVLLFGLGMLLAGTYRTSRRSRAARAELRDSRRQGAAMGEDRDNPAALRDTARMDPVGGSPDGSPRTDAPPARGVTHRRRHLFGH